MVNFSIYAKVTAIFCNFVHIMTKKSFILCTFLVVGSFLLCSCYKKNKSAKVLTLPITKAVIDTTAHLSDNITCEVHVEFSYLKGEKYSTTTDSLLRMGLLQPDYLSILNEHITPKHALIIFAEKYIKEYFYMAKLIRQHEKQNAKTKGKLSINVTLSSGDGDNIVATSNISIDDGSGIKTKYCIIRNFNPKTGKLLTLKDRYGNKEMNNVIIDAFGKKLNIDNPTLKDIQAKGFFENINIYPASNYIFTDDSTIFVYNPGEINSKGIRIAIEK
jgi:hypothetical protein